MRTRTAAAAACRTLSLMAVSVFAGALMLLGGCGPAMTRPKVAQDELVKLRSGGMSRPWRQAARCLAG